MTHTPAPIRAVDLRIQYFSGDEIFAETRGLLELPAGEDIDAAAAKLAEDHPYHNQRVPDLSYRVRILSTDPDNRDPPPAGAGVKPVCGRCGAEEVLRDACARWDSRTQLWTLAGTHDCTTCEICGAAGDELARWVPLEPGAAAAQFLRDLAAMLGQPSLGENLQFQQFCLEHFRGGDLGAAAATWTSLSANA